MSVASELKIVFTGPMGAGKTTAITAVSDFPPVSTEMRNNDQQSFAKESTTVALDLGQIGLEDGTVVRLYGTPGQERFSFMWEIIGRGAMGVILLLDGSSPAVLDDLKTYTEVFRRIAPEQPFVIGVGRTRPDDNAQIEACMRVLEALQFSAPMFSVDVRKREDVLLLIETLLATLEVRQPEIENEPA
ncbi:GTP-binding protein [Steroidobacter sp.]|uniref:GTP-binding protein n=1 Tax=Steroidobacter sp. TaxID=1978227 RepID=UPI001A587802|nr:ATP/GTP-binding protein [Steroidobacter sp.]MBL8265325.1 ATP/GTP-binding protein [Steroidobacter sp.]